MIDFTKSYTLVATSEYLPSDFKDNKPQLYEAALDDIATGFNAFLPYDSSTFEADPEGGTVLDYYPYAYDQVVLEGED